MEPAFRVRFEAPPIARTPAERLLATCDLHEVAIAQITARLCRENPAIAASEIDVAVRRWLAGGDPGPGRPRTWSG